MNSYSVIIPVYRSGQWLPELVERIKNALLAANVNFEVILINDASPDKGYTWNVIEELSNQNSWLRGFNLKYNTGQFRATICGMEAARGDYIITMDDDFQHAPEELIKLMNCMKDNPEMDCIFGLYDERKHNMFRRVGSKIVSSLLNRLYGKPKDITTTSFRIMKKDFAKTILLYKSAMPQIGPIISTLSKNIMNVSVKHYLRKYGESNYGIIRLVKETMISIINSTVLPLRVISIIGLLSAIGSFILTFYYLCRYIFNGIGVAGFTTQVLIITFFSGLILLSLGFIGEYIGRIITELTGMPRYVVSNETNFETNEDNDKVITKC